jgi:hypothetical protein
MMSLRSALIYNGIPGRQLSKAAQTSATAKLSRTRKKRHSLAAARISAEWIVGLPGRIPHLSESCPLKP